MNFFLVAQLRKVAVVCYRGRIILLHFVFLWCFYFAFIRLRIYLLVSILALSFGAYLLFHFFLHLINPILDLVNIHLDTFLVKLVWISCFQELAVSPYPLRDWLVIHIVGSHPTDHAVLKLPNILAPIAEEQVAFPMFLEVLHLSEVHLALRIFDLSVSYNLVLLPLSTDDLSRGEYETSFPVKLVSEAISNILISV